jgi:hypothetical protein
MTAEALPTAIPYMAQLNLRCRPNIKPMGAVAFSTTQPCKAAAFIHGMAFQAI